MQEILQNIDTRTIIGVAAAAYVFVGALKSAWPNWASGKEELLALAGAVAIGALMKRWGDAFQDDAWGNHIVNCMLAGMFSQVLHDKLMDPILNQIKNSGTPPAPVDAPKT